VTRLSNGVNVGRWDNRIYNLTIRGIDAKIKLRVGGNGSLSRGNFPESGRDVGENLIAETLSCPSTTRKP